MGQISPHPNGAPQETKSDLAYQYLQLPCDLLFQNIKKYHASDAYPRAVPNGTLAKPTFEVLI